MEKTNIMKIDALRVEGAQLRKTMKGINPKLSIYATYQKKQDAIATQISKLKSELK